MEIQEALYIKELILKELSGDIDKQEKQILETWLEATPANRKLREKIETDYFLKQVVTDESALFNQEWEKLNEKTIFRRQKARIRFFKYAAVILFPLLMATVLWVHQDETAIPPAIVATTSTGVRLQLSDGSVIPLQQDTNAYIESNGMALHHDHDSLCINSFGSPAQPLTWQKVILPKGVDYIVKLEDGTYIHLNAESTLEIPNQFSSEERRIRLSGGAYLQVHQEEHRPFIVETAHSYVKVLGTQFDLRSYPEELQMRTTLIRGSVEVTHNREKVLLEPGHQAIVSKTGGITVQPVDTYRYTAWRDRRLVFENEYITDIIEELKHWYDYDFILTDPAIRQVRLSMNIERFDRFEELKNAIEKTEKIHFQINGKIVKITP